MGIQSVFRDVLKGAGGGDGPANRAIAVVEGAIGGAERSASLAALFPHVDFATIGADWSQASGRSYDIVIIGVNAASSTEVEAAVRLGKARSFAGQVVVVLRDADVATMRALTREGIADVLPAPVSEPALALSLERLLGAGPTPARRTTGEVVAVVKAGGGVGATALCVQVGAQLAGRIAGGVCVADLDLQFGAADVYLDLAESLSVMDVLASGVGLAETPFRDALAAHRSGLRLLAAPRDVTPLETLTPQAVDALFHGLRRDFALTLVDLPPVWTAWTNQVLTLADRIVMVTHLSVPHVQLVKRQLRILAAQGLDTRPLILACNGLSPDQTASVSIKAAERALGRAFDVVIPEDRKVMTGALNEGVEIAAVRRGTKLEKAVADLAGKVAAMAPAGAGQGGLTAMLWKPTDPASNKSAQKAPFSQGAAIEGATALKVRIHQRLLELLNLGVLDKTPREALRLEIRGAVSALLTEEKRILSLGQTDQLVEDVLDEILGLGPLEPLLKDDTVSDILINTHATVYVERQGRLERTGVQFQDTRHLVRIINKIVSAVGRRVDESQPMVDARLADGSRVNAIIPPLAVDGPLVSIRKFARQPIDMTKLVELGSLSAEMAQLLSAVVQARRNVLISGGTGSGKTTLLNALSAFIDDHERIVTIEDSAELQMQQPHVGRLETRPPNIEGRGEITQRDLVRNALRMRPDRIIVGEVRAGEAFDMLQAMNTGHDGSMTTVHANTPRDALSRVEQMIGMAGLEISPRSIRQQIAAAINVVVQVERMDDGRRRIVSIAEIVGMEEDVISMQEIFRFSRAGRATGGGVAGDFEMTGVRPRFLDVAKARGIETPTLTFAAGRKSV